MTRQEQLAHLDRAIRLRPERAWYRETHAIYSIDESLFVQASADLDTAIALADRPYLRFLRGLVRCQRGMYESSLSDFDLAIQGQPQNAQFYRGRSLARSKIGRYREALNDARRLLSLVPQQAETHYAMGVALVGLGDVTQAIRSYDEAVRLRPELIYPLRARAEAFRLAGDSARAGSDLELAAQKEREGTSRPLNVDPFRY